MNRKKPSLKEKMGYRFDNIMSKGTIALVGMLFLVTAIVVVIAALLSALVVGDQSIGELIWKSSMHAIDAGNLGGDDTGNASFVFMMTLVTICGIFVTSILIGIISTGFEGKLNELRKGTSKVLESGHVVILGFNDSVYTLISELVEAGSNQKNQCIIILGEEEKEVMEESVRGNISDFKTTKVICRSGKLTESYLFERASLDTARSVIINQEDDFSTIKIILALVQFMKSKKAFDNDFHITTTIHSEANLDAAMIASEGRAEVIFFEDTLSRIIAHTCRQPGLSAVYTEFFDFDGDEFYFENFPELAGKTFADVLSLFEQSIVVGLEKDGKVLLNPPMNTLLGQADQIIHLAEDDETSMPDLTVKMPDLTKVMADPSNKKPTSLEDHNNLLVLGYNSSLPDILEELDKYVENGTKVLVACDQIEEEELDEHTYNNMSLVTRECDIYRRVELESLIKEGDFRNILLLSEFDCSLDEADAKTLLLLIQLRDITNKWGTKFNITSEMRSVSNQKLAKIADVNDFVVGSSITNLIISQVSENRQLLTLFKDLLDSEGSELYMKNALNYVKEGAEVDFRTITEIAKLKGEIPIGYKKTVKGEMELVINPKKSAPVVFEQGDSLILIAEDNS